MSNLYVTEYAGYSRSANQGVLAVEPESKTKVVAFTGTHGESDAFLPNTSVVRIHTDGICSIFFSVAGTAATTSNRRMVAGQTEYFQVPVNQGYKVSAITNT